MINLNPCHRTFDTFHARFQDDTLPESLSRAAFARFDRDAYDPHLLALGLDAWQARLLDEYRSQVAFTDLVQDLTSLGSSFDILGTGIRVVGDELRHVELCRRMVHALGGDDNIPGEASFVNPDESLPRVERVLQTTVGFLCVGETVSVRLIAAVRETTPDPLAKEIMTCLARDESIHARFGWTLLEVLTPVISPEDRKTVSSLLPYYLGSVEEAVIASAGDDQHGHNPFGFLSGEARMDAFSDSLRRDILPRFEALGYPAEEAWENRARG